MTARLIYVVGASGSGKDSLMRYARERFAGDPGILFAHRYITRPADAGGENHVALSPEEFDARLKARLFALHWESHGHAYGVGIEINQWLTKGVTVVVNGSRAYLPEARCRYPELLPLWIDVSPEVLRDRLQARGRESEAAIETRLTRHRTLQAQPRDGMVITNDGPLAEAGEALVDLIARHTHLSPCA
ncbi:MAG: phosphonate metabolism protein/1,5-bisphosphokinase (PRPP-forming) PhnN [Deltaproteobacteria bacterium]|nr:phosphonate metabolism protein/1,5-bisphosphokinase (PRPP-forming) PhnN [Deltaproteobacteria bacterium]